MEKIIKTYYVWNGGECQNKTNSLIDARKWLKDFNEKDKTENYILDENNSLIDESFLEEYKAKNIFGELVIVNEKQKNALYNFKLENKRTWKAKLHKLWSEGNYVRPEVGTIVRKEDVYLLAQLRNLSLDLKKL